MPHKFKPPGKPEQAVDGTVIPWMQRIATAYYVGKGHVLNGHWSPVPLARSGEEQLLEIWQRGTEFFVHPGRNPFHPVANDEQRKRWHSVVATGDLMKDCFDNHPSPNQKRIRRKTREIPDWAESSNGVIGYTSKDTLTLGPNPEPQLRNLKDKSKFEYYPSVYFKKGHATIDHEDQGNIGWEFSELGWTCVFFGNVIRSERKKLLIYYR